MSRRRGWVAALVTAIGIAGCGSSATAPNTRDPGSTTDRSTSVSSAPSPSTLDRKARGCVRVQASLAEQAAINSHAAGTPTVAIIGDSYVAGNGASDARHGWAYLLAKDEGWRGILLGVGGSGLKNDGPCDGQTYLARVDQAAAVAPAAVIIEGGLNDRQASAAEEARLVRQLITALRTRIPGVAIALVGPPAPGPSYVPGVAKISGAFRAAAAATGVRFVDPYGENWFNPSNRPELIAPDGIHPNQRGHVYFADRVAQDLRGWL